MIAEPDAAALEPSIHAARLRAQLLSGPPVRGPVAVAERLLAVQGQDPKGARLAIRVRSTTRSVADVDRELSVQRSLLITWLNRGTLHLVRSEDYPWLHALTTPPLFTGNARRLAQEGVTAAAADRGVAVIARALSDEGPLTRLQLRDRIAAADVRTEGQALVHILMLASLRGLVVRGPMLGAEHAYVLVRDWLGESPSVPRAGALAELARRYLAGHGPAGPRDLARWAGLPLRDARAGLAAVASELVQRPHGLVDLAHGRRGHGPTRPRLLGAFDPVLLGWTSRAALLGPHQRLITVNGLFRPFALVGGRAAGLWTLAGSRVAVEPFTRLQDADASALTRDGEDVVSFLGRS